MTIEFGNRLQELRKQKGLSQEELAERLGVSRQAVSKWECGEASPDTDNLIELSKIYCISLDVLVGKGPLPEKVEVPEEKEDEDHDEDEEEEKKHPVYTMVNVVVSSISVLLIIVAYVLLGSLLNLWGQAWVLFLLIPVIPSILDAIFYKNMKRFVYPVFIAFLYLTLCVWFPGGLWHPLWVMFLTIPLYYIIGDLIEKIKNR